MSQPPSAFVIHGPRKCILLPCVTIWPLSFPMFSPVKFCLLFSVMTMFWVCPTFTCKGFRFDVLTGQVPLDIWYGPAVLPEELSKILFSRSTRSLRPWFFLFYVPTPPPPPPPQNPPPQASLFLLSNLCWDGAFFPFFFFRFYRNAFLPFFFKTYCFPPLRLPGNLFLFSGNGFVGPS